MGKTEGRLNVTRKSSRIRWLFGLKNDRSRRTAELWRRISIHDDPSPQCEPRFDPDRKVADILCTHLEPRASEQSRVAVFNVCKCIIRFWRNVTEIERPALDG